MCAERSPELLICLMGIWKAGAVYLPVDRKYPIERVEYVLKDARARVLLQLEPPTTGELRWNGCLLNRQELSAGLAIRGMRAPDLQPSAAELAYVKIGRASCR